MKHLSIRSKFPEINNKYIYENGAKIGKNFAPFVKKLSNEEKDVLKSYKINGYKQINQVLIDYKYPQISISDVFDRIEKLQKILNYEDLVELFFEMINKPIKDINELDNVFKKLISYKTKKLTTPLFRGILGNKRIKGLKKGQTFTFNEFLSTSLSPSIAFRFQHCGEKTCCILIFHVDNKLPYIPLYSYNKKAYDTVHDEHEILLPRSTSWKLIDKYKISIDFDDISCTYKQINNSKKRKITVYEFQAEDYVLPKTPLKFLEKSRWYSYVYSESKKLKIPFIVKNDFSLDQPDIDIINDKKIAEKWKAQEEKRKAKEEKRKAEEEKRKAKEEKRKAEEEKRKAQEEKKKAKEAAKEPVAGKS